MAELASPLEIDYSTLSLFQLCPARYMWRHECNLATQPSSAMYFGTCLHLSIQAYHLRLAESGSHSEAKDIAWSIFQQHWDEDLYAQPGSFRTKEAARQVIEFYHNSPVLKQFRVTHTEQLGRRLVLEADGSLPPVYLTGLADQIGASLDTGCAIGHDIKTHGNRMPPFAHLDLMSQQYQGYCFMFECDRWLVEHVGCSKSKGPEISVIPVELSAVFLKYLRANVESWRRNLPVYKQTASFPRHSPYACSAYYDQCPYWNLCYTGVEPAPDYTVSDPLAYEFRREKWSPAMSSKVRLSRMRGTAS